jgi:hypothetical protein
VFERLVRSVLVVVGDVVDGETLELLVPDDGQVEEFTAKSPCPLFGEGVGRRGADKGLVLSPSVRRTSSKASVNWLPDLG